MTMPPIHPLFPSDETLSRFIDGRLDASTRQRVIDHLAGCEECYSVWLAATEIASALGPAGKESKESDDDDVKGFPFFRKGIVAAGLAVAATIAAVMLVPQLRDRVPFVSGPGIPALAKAAGPYRPAESRMSGFAHAPLDPAKAAKRGHEESEPDLASPELLNVASKIESKASGNPSADNLHAVGVAYFTIGEFAQAKTKLEQSLSIETKSTDLAVAVSKSRNVRLLSDLAAAEYALWKATADRNALHSASVTIDRAWSLAPGPEVAWNRALIRAVAGPRSEALAAWNAYLPLEKSPEWLQEARVRIRELQEK
jgi:tetratricopeptide (TPR) repeat protein